ncbi:hypothetical protein NKR23_g6446 [Pleurostoma richardsiae]|uniref:Uncharacterized protein n=1 Tax=Pleurostoma richardsiae TaxID=41990 RepID=A0AA38RKZ5_9PEZI|nr:hypothetical protein NKR23_g6446 [Pleurostoma richardsiae]
MGFLVYWVITFPILNIPLPKFRRWVEVEAAIMPLVLFGIFIYCIVTGKGAEERPLTQARMHGCWNQLYDAGNINHVNRSLSLSLSLANIVGAVLSIFGTAAIYNKWGNLDWNPRILERDILTQTSRAAVFFVSGFSSTPTR